MMKVPHCRTSRSQIANYIILVMMFSAPMFAQSPAPTELDRHGIQIPATLPTMYRYAFRVQNSLETLAADREKHSLSGDPVRESLRAQLRMSESDFATFRSAAQHYGKQEQQTRKQMRSLVEADVNKHPRTRALWDVTKTAVHTLANGMDESLATEILNLRYSLSANATVSLDRAVTSFYSQGQRDGQTIAGVANPAGRVASGAGEASTGDAQAKAATATTATTSPAATEGPGDPACMTACNLPINMTNLLFTADGQTVIATASASISEDDYDNGCYPDITVDIVQNGSTVASSEADSWFLTASTTVSAPVNIGSKYNIGGYVQSCNQAQACTGAIIAGGPGFTTGPPSISSVSPSADAIGNSGTIQINGSDLGGPPGNTPSVSVSGSGLSIEASGPANYSGSNTDLAVSSLGLNYSISSSAGPGVDSYTLSTVWGTSQATTFSVYCGSPSIASVLPANWDAGESYNITISGSGFCNTSSVNVSVSTGSVNLMNIKYVNSQTITATVMPADTDPTETAVVTVVTSPASAAIAPKPLNASATPASLGGGTATYNAMVTSTIGTIYLVDPQLFQATTGGSGSIDPASLINALQTNFSSIQALGMTTDGAATAIAVYKSLINAPICFAASAGLTFSSWNSSFLSSAPASGSASTGAVSPIQQVNGYYYFFALVHSPAESSLTASVSGRPAGYINAGPAQNCSGAQTSIKIAPTPVLFIHGLWGDNTSLSETLTYLGSTTPWGGTDPLGGYGLQAICYSKYLAFNAPGTDPVAETCPVTARQAMTSYFQSLNNQLDSIHFVGGRVDVVAHSMGGLVARDYSSLTTQYNSNRTFGQGLFRTVVTLDTPEQGSALATDLLVNEQNRIVDTSGTMSALAIRQVCGAGSTLGQCFSGKLGKPLGPPGSASGVGGAVWSLEPGCSTITSLPSPNIAGSRWVAISSDYSDSPTSVCSQKSLPRDILNLFIASTYTTTPPPPTLSSILGTTESDVIVTIPSQTTAQGATPATSIRYPSISKPTACYSHTGFGLPGGLAGLVSSDSNASVTTSPAVDSSVACALLPGSLSCTTAQSSILPQSISASALDSDLQAQAEPKLDSAQPQLPLTSEADQIELWKHPRTLAPERIKLVMPTLQVPLGSPFEATVQIAPGELFMPILVTQYEPNGPVAGDGSEIAKVTRDSGLVKTIQIVPWRLGQVDVEVSATYKDNAYATQILHLNVVPSAKGLKKFSLLKGLAPLHIDMVMADEKRDREDRLEPTVSYEGLSRDLYPAMGDLNYSIDQSASDPVIQIDKFGKILALRAGKAVIKAEYAGMTDQVTVNVYSKADAPINWRQTHPPQNQ